jgi:hypothetical protein
MKHLSPEQISSLIAGVESPEGAHIRDCAVCALEVDRMKAVLMQFRGSVRVWTDKLNQSAFPVPEAIALRGNNSYARRRAPMAWVLATAALAAAVAIPSYRESVEKAREQAIKAQRDDQLLMDVNAHLSRSGPMAMDPLMRMMRMMSEPTLPDSDSGAAEDNQGNRGNRGNGGEK